METVELIERLEECLSLQNELNQMICSENWVETVQMNAIKAAYLDEICEFMNEFPWKYWKQYKDKTIDYNKVKLELVEAFHFVLSMYIKKNDTLSITPDIAGSLHLLVETDSKAEKHPKNVYDVINVLIFILCSVDSKNSNSFLLLFLLSCIPYMSLDELFKLYMLQNALNRLRQKRGYTDKFIDVNGKQIEDNELLLQLSKNIEFENFVDLLNELEAYFVAKED